MADAELTGLEVGAQHGKVLRATVPADTLHAAAHTVQYGSVQVCAEQEVSTLVSLPRNMTASAFMEVQGSASAKVGLSPAAGKPSNIGCLHGEESYAGWSDRHAQQQQLNSIQCGMLAQCRRKVNNLLSYFYQLFAIFTYL